MKTSGRMGKLNLQCINNTIIIKCVLVVAAKQRLLAAPLLLQKHQKVGVTYASEGRLFCLKIVNTEVPDHLSTDNGLTCSWSVYLHVYGHGVICIIYEDIF